MGLYGVVMIGADVCGFEGDATAELCARWTQLGALYPFARNHACIGTRDQEAYRFGEPYTSLNRNSIKLRYTLLPYYTTLYVQASQRGWPVWRSLMMEFPDDEATWPIDRQFMIGPALMGVPILVQGADTVDGYLPNADWFNYLTSARLTSFDTAPGAAGQNFSFCSTLDDTAHIPIIQRGGTVVHSQVAGMTTFETIDTPYTLHIALDHTGHAVGAAALIDPDALDLDNPTGAPPSWLSSETAALTYNGTAGLVGRIHHALEGKSQYNITGKAIQSMVVAGLDLPDGTTVAMPSFSVGDRSVPLTGVTLAVENGALVLSDPSAALFRLSVPAWTLLWGSRVEGRGQQPERPRVDAQSLPLASE